MIELWRFNSTHNTICKIIDEQTLWGEISYRVWLPDKNVVLRAQATDLRPLDGIIKPEQEVHRISYIATAARIAASQSEDALLAPIGSNVIPLPHQLKALNKAISKSQVRYLLADEVGLGKTIEAGLVMRELKLRGLVNRTLVVAPKGIATQWVSEMQIHFNEPFQLLLPENLGPASLVNPWKTTGKSTIRLSVLWIRLSLSKSEKAGVWIKLINTTSNDLMTLYLLAGT
jgi:SNF2 family DNA or RNA helicase